MEREIIGYKVPYDLWLGDVKAGSIYYPIKSSGNKNFGSAGDISNSDLFLPAEVVTKWEPIYNEKFAIGDIVVFEVKRSYLDNNPVWNEDITLRVDNMRGGTLLFDVNQFIRHENFNKMIYDGTKYRTNYTIFFRMATEQESIAFKQLHFKKGDFLLCIKSVNKSVNSLALNDPFTCGKIYKAESDCSLLNNNNRTHVIGKAFGYEHFRIANIEEIKSISYKEAYFGDVRFRIDNGNEYAVSAYGIIYKTDIENVIKYIECPPTLAGHTFNIHVNEKVFNLANIDASETAKLGFGDNAGTLDELKNILSLMGG